MYLSDEKPYWWDIKSQLTIVVDMSEVALKALANGGQAWVNDVVTADDPVAAFTKGKMTMV